MTITIPMFWIGFAVGMVAQLFILIVWALARSASILEGEDYEKNEVSRKDTE